MDLDNELFEETLEECGAMESSKMNICEVEIGVMLSHVIDRSIKMEFLTSH